MKKLTIIDASACIKGGTFMGISKSMDCLGVQVGGLVAILRQVMISLDSGGQVMVAFDSPTYRKDIMPTYKEGRKVDFSFGLQRSLAWVFLKELGIQCVKEDGYEADDLIVYAVKANKKKYDKITIITNDLDLSQLVDSQGKVCTLSPTAIAPSVNVGNFEVIMKSKRNCEFNTVLINKLVWGDSSDNVGVFNLEGGVKARKALEIELVNLAKSMYKEPANWNSPKVIMKWLESDSTILKNFSKDELENFKTRFLVFYPITPKLEFKETLACKEITQINLDAAERIFAMLRNNALAHQWRCEVRKPTKEMCDFMYALKNLRRDQERAYSEGREIDWSLTSIERVSKMYDELYNPVSTDAF